MVGSTVRHNYIYIIVVILNSGEVYIYVGVDYIDL